MYEVSIDNGETESRFTFESLDAARAKYESARATAFSVMLIEHGPRRSRVLLSFSR